MATAKTATGTLRKALTAKLRALGYPVSASVNNWPRVQLEDVTEAEPIDKGYDVRELGFIVEVVSLGNYAEADTAMTAIEEGLIGTDTITMTGFACLEIYKELGQEIVAVGDADKLEITRRTQFRANIATKAGSGSGSGNGNTNN